MTCLLHRAHSPVALTVEVHHIVPVAWQLFWQPAQPWPFPGADTEGRGMLWDDRTVECCPTGHRNVHHLIVRLMHEVKRGVIDTKAGASLPGAQPLYAGQALIRFQEAGGSLPALAAAGEWGES